ncbi:MAG: DNA/RNA nuclease SfsA [Oscillospiraceae bacterium]|nr:DNA/RNA nuclease SfsA [Oscillospiraceae bacterium]
MEYQELLSAIFMERPNRFVAICILDGEPVAAHVKNTGRCRELLVPGAEVLLQYHPAPGRKTRYTLTHVQKGERLIHIDSQAPNHLVEEALRQGRLALPGFGTPELIRPETFYGDSRFDFYLEAVEKRGFAEIKGVTLEEEGWARFPDAPTERGVKHLEHLARAAAQGYWCYVIFVIQMSGIRGFSPNWRTHPAFGEALLKAQKAGVVPLAFESIVTPQRVELSAPVEIDLLKGRGQSC